MFTDVYCLASRIFMSLNFLGCELNACSPETLPLCTSMDQLLRHFQLDQDLYLRHEQKIIINMTDCDVPCTYKAQQTFCNELKTKICNFRNMELLKFQLAT